MCRVKRKYKLAILFTLLSIAWVAVLFVESSQPAAKIMGEISGLDKVAHFAAFGIFALLICVAWYCARGKQSMVVFIGPLLLTSLVGIVEEGYQLTVPERAASYGDILADICGAIFAVMVARYSLLLNVFKRWMWR